MKKQITPITDDVLTSLVTAISSLLVIAIILLRVELRLRLYELAVRAASRARTLWVTCLPSHK
jgi:hypothetical protein